VKPRYLTHGGKPLLLVGVNYWARSGGPLMWRRWQPQEVAQELRQMRDLGMNVCRSFLYTPDFMPTPHRVEPEMLGRLDEFMTLCRQAGVLTIPTFFVGHMSGENWDLPWRHGRDLYTDPWMLDRERLYVSTIAARYRDEEAVLAWLLSNEIPLYGGNTDSAKGLLWTRTLCEAIRHADPRHPISTGDGAWSVSGSDNGFPLDDVSAVVDFLGPHTYPTETDSLRHSYYPSFLMRMTADYGVPTLLEEFGCSTAHASYRYQADYYRTTLNSVLLAGGAGALGWCYSDFALTHQRPYSHHPFELLFGVTRADGEPKPAAREIKRFASLVAGLDLERMELPEPDAAIAVPSYYSYDYPFAAFDRAAMQRCFLEAYVLAKQAHLPVDFWREPRILSRVAESIDDPATPSPPPRRLLILPGCQGLTAPAMEALVAFAREGGTVYWSYAHPPWLHNFEQLFGATHHLRYGLADAAPDKMRLRFRHDFGELSAGDEVRVAGAGAQRCPVTPLSAEVIAEDDSGQPVMLLHRLGQGKVVFMGISLETALARMPECHDGRADAEPAADAMVRIYRSLAMEAGIERALDTDSPLVELGPMRVGDRRLLWLVNHSWRRAEGVVKSGAHVRARDLESSRETGAGSRIPYQLEPKDVQVWELEGA